MKESQNSNFSRGEGLAGPREIVALTELYTGNTSRMVFLFGLDSLGRRSGVYTFGK